MKQKTGTIYHMNNVLRLLLLILLSIMDQDLIPHCYSSSCCSCSCGSDFFKKA